MTAFSHIYDNMAVTDLQLQITEVEDTITSLKSRKKSTSAARATLAKLQERLVEAEKVATQSTPKRRGRPRKYRAEYYELRDSLKRNRRGRPSREQVIADLDKLGVTYDVEATTRSLELLRKRAVQGAIKLAK